MKTTIHIKYYFILLLFATISNLTLAEECSDSKSQSSSNKISLAYIEGNLTQNSNTQLKASIFKEAAVLNKHLPSNSKEVASYIKYNGLYYTVYTLVNSECIARITKNTYGKY